MTCQACKDRGQTWNGDAPVCAFDDFDKNWNCATVGAIRDIVYDGQHPMPEGVDYRYCDDMKYATIKTDSMDDVPAMALWVAWHKNRGSTDALWLLDSDMPPRRPTEAECLAICATYGITPDTGDGHE